MVTESCQDDAKHLFSLIRDIKFAMLTTTDEDGSLRSRPMANKQADEFDGELWFFTHASAAKVDEVEKESKVNVSFAEPDKQTYVSISGTCLLVRDMAKVRELWSPYMKAWFPGGLEDPDLALLKISIGKAEYWDTPNSTMVQLFGMAKSALTGEAANPGENRKLNFG